MAGLFNLIPDAVEIKFSQRDVANSVPPRQRIVAGDIDHDDLVDHLFIDWKCRSRLLLQKVHTMLQG
jgi:hypothetical protein